MAAPFSHTFFHMHYTHVLFMMSQVICDWVIPPIIATTIHVQNVVASTWNEYSMWWAPHEMRIAHFMCNTHSTWNEYSELPAHMQAALCVWHRLSHTLHSRLVFFTRYTHVLCMMSHVTESYHTTGGGDRTSNNYDCQNFDQVFTESP